LIYNDARDIDQKDKFYFEIKNKTTKDVTIQSGEKEMGS